MQFLPHISSPSSQIWKHQDKRGLFLKTRWTFYIWVPTALCYLWKCSFCPISPIQVVGHETFQDNSGSFFQDKHLNTPILCYLWKCSFYPISPLQVVRLEKFLDKSGSFFSRWMFGVPMPLCYLQKCSFCPISPVCLLDLKIARLKLVIFLRWTFWVPTLYVIFENAVLPHISLSK